MATKIPAFKLRHGGKTYYYYKLCKSLAEVRALKAKFPRLRYYYIKGWDNKKNTPVYHCYLDAYIR